MITAHSTGIDSENCLPIGTRLADFEIKGIIGEGGFGIVYLAFDHSLRRTVAIKEYMPETLAGRGADKSVVLRSERHQKTFETGLKGFIQEARLLAQFDHPALIKVHRFWEQNNTGYMVMRYYEGRTLKEIIRNDPALLTEAWLKSMLKPMLEALDALYQVNILHRDISPDNIMIQQTGEAVLLDFGAARQIIGDITQALTVILKPGYAPIEQYADDTSMKQGPWTDIYALSAVVYAAIAKKPPPTSVARMIKDPIEPLQAGTYPGFSKEFLSAIDQGLRVKPEERPQSIEAFRKLLGLEDDAPAQSEAGAVGTLVKAASPAAPEKEVEAVPRTKKRTLTTGAWAILAAATLIAAGSYQFFRDRPTPPVANKPGLPAPKTAPDTLPATPPAAAVPPLAEEVKPQEKPVIDDEQLAWEALRDADDTKPDDLANFIRRNPSGKYVKQAAEKLRAMNQKKIAASARKSDDAHAADKSGKAEPAPQPRESKPAAGQPNNLVHLEIKPWGTIMVDGVWAGVSPPLKRLTLTEGKHQIRIINPNFPDYVTEIQVDDGKPGRIEHDFYPGSKKYTWKR